MPPDWDENLLHSVLAAIRAAPSSATGLTPIRVLLGRDPILPVDMSVNGVDLEGKLGEISVTNFCSLC